MNPHRPTAAPVRNAAAIARFETIDAAFLDWARAWGAEELQFPSLIGRPTLERAGYPEAFPHLLLGTCGCADPAKPLGDLLAAANLAPTDWLLSPAVCYHVYPHWHHAPHSMPRVATARGRCFRRESEFVPGRRQIEFEMREIVLCGPPAWIDARVAEALDRVDTLANAFGLRGSWETATDPFFLPTAQGKVYLQRLQGTKKEFVVAKPAPLALASINRHGTFFAERFQLHLPDGALARTACIAFGLDRWASLQRGRAACATPARGGVVPAAV